MRSEQATEDENKGLARYNLEEHVDDARQKKQGWDTQPHPYVVPEIGREGLGKTVPAYLLYRDGYQGNRRTGWAI